MAARLPFWKWHRWKSIGFCLWPPSTCIWNLKLKFQSKLDLCSGNHVVYRHTDRRTDGRTDKVNPVYPPPSNFVGWGHNNFIYFETSKLVLSIFPDITLKAWESIYLTVQLRSWYRHYLITPVTPKSFLKKQIWLGYIWTPQPIESDSRKSFYA